jgi:hypothetical protein
MTEKMKIVFAEGCFDDFDGTQEELAEIIADLQTMVDDGTLLENSERLTPEEEDDLIEMLKSKAPRQ